jgi:hypothetical protein
MMNNAITILVDSVIWDCVGTTRCKVSPTPFLDSLKKESVTATKLYSHGPYTDAATRSLYTGRRCLDDFAYYFKLNTSPTNHFKVFHDNGYETYGLYYPYYMVGTEMRRSIDYTFYTAGFIFGSEWGGCFYYYSDIIKTRKLNKHEVALLKIRMKMMLDIWMQFYKDIIEKPSSAAMISDIVEKFDVRSALKTLEEQNELLEINPESYIYDFLQQGKSHILASLDGIDVDSMIDRNFLDEGVYKYYKDFFSYASKINFKANWWKNRPELKRIIACISKYVKTKNQNDIMLLANYLMCVNSINNVKKQSKKHWQDLPSARTQLDFAVKVLENVKDNGKPFYMSLHFLEPHNYVSFFSFDSQERKVLDEEFNMLFDYCKELGSDFIGNLSYFLSIRYADYCIERFCNKLKEMGLWEDMVLTILSDHGSSYSFYPLHGPHVNCFDEECYHVPVLIRKPNMQGIEITSYHNSMDILPTLYELMGFEKPEDVLGVSLLDKNVLPKDYVMTEYMGPGCPDLLSRPIWFSIRDKHYSLGYKVGIYQNFEDGDLCEVYNLDDDPNGFNNIATIINRDRLEYLLSHLRDRFDEIKKSSFEFIEKIDKTNIFDLNEFFSQRFKP